jgi:hypothetical protein
MVIYGNPQVPTVARVVMSAAVMLFGISTTAILAFLTRGYVCHMWITPDGQRLLIDTLTLFVRTKTHEISVQDIRPPDTMLPYVTFEANGKLFYVEGSRFEDQQLWKKLFPFAVKEEESTMKKKEKEKENENEKEREKENQKEKEIDKEKQRQAGE